MLRVITRIQAGFQVQLKEAGLSNELARAITNQNFSRVKLHLYQNASSTDNSLMKVLKMKNQVVKNIDIFESMKHYDMDDLSLSLSFIGSGQKKIKQQMISQLTYKEMIEIYFSKSNSSGSDKFDLVSTFIYLQNPTLRDFIKRNQIKLLEGLVKRQPVSTHQFESILSPELFNITDMPAIYDYFYQIYFPSLVGITTLQQVHKTLIYLSKFSKLPLFFPRRVLQILQEEILSSKQLTYSHFLQICNVIYLMIFHFSKYLQEMKLKSEFLALFQKLTKRSISSHAASENYALQMQKQGSNDPEIFFLNLKCLNLNEIIQTFEQRKNHLENLKETLSHALKLKLKAKDEDQFCLNLILGEQIKKINKIMDKKANQLLQRTFTEMKIKQCRTYLLAAMMPTLNPSIFYNYIGEDKNLKFLKKNICAPHLQRSFDIVQSTIKKDEDQALGQERLSKLCKSFKNRLDKLITPDNLKAFSEELIKKEDIISKSSTISYLKDFEELLWAEDGIDKFVGLQPRYDISKTNALLMVKNDPQYLLSLMRWDSKSFLSQFYMQKEFRSFGFNADPCRYTEGIGFKVTEEGKRKTSYLRIQHQLNNWNAQKSEQNGLLLRGNLKNMIKSLRRLKKPI